MKKITLFFAIAMLVAFTFSSYAQTLNQNANWPNADWSLSGAYSAGGLLSDPTVDATFGFDDDAAGITSVDNIQATSPVIDLTAAQIAGENWINVSGNFVYRALGGDVLTIETYDADAMTWTALDTFLGNSTNTNFQNCNGTVAYASAFLNISGFTATQLSGFQYRIAYDDVGGWLWGFCFEAPTVISTSCPEPSGLTATAITDTTANLGWTEIGTATLWNVELVDITAGGIATGTATASGVANPYMATGLTPDNNYEFWVQAQCGGGTTNWVGPFAFRTTCVITAPYTEDFEMFTTAEDVAFAIENCWTGTGGAYFWESAPGTDTGSDDTGPAPSITTGNYFYSEASDGATGDTADLISPLFDLSALTTPALTFNYHMFGNKIGTLDVLVNGITNVWTLSGEQQASETTPWELAVIDLSAYANQSITITFRATSAGLFEGDIAIDNVSFTELPTCPKPFVLTAANITDTTADLGWTENGTATSWNVELVDITAGGTATGTATTSGVTNPYTATGLTQDNNYEFYVQSDCGEDDVSTWAGPFAFSTLETCPMPSGLTATTITETTANLGWTENGTATSWNIELVDVTAGETATGIATATDVTSPFAATGLVGDNTYQFYVQADCGVDGVSAWAGPSTFITSYVAVPPSCSNGTFLDSGGISRNYSDNQNISYTITPDTAGGTVSVYFSFFSAENNGSNACYDGLTIYNGEDDTAATINPPGGGTIWCWDRNDTPAVGTGDLQGMTITSTDPSGALTFVFSSDSTVQRAGWEATVDCHTLTTQDVENDLAFSYYPNPVKETLFLQAQNNIQKVSVYNMLGQEVLHNTPNSLEENLDLSALQTGTYFVKVTIDNATETVRIIKN
ncbi:fibronectin type III domain-containing protein [uncultured Psychroserpens sp.]|uniref:fibronectin type III domain-containing protein n=1 Tax=uncultured Psychroserpens sp. TaxID=255436 RepID=UPI00261A6298|nr:fibronectin type III domain-containing protein [uncultured Psychroserpens sp.]